MSSYNNAYANNLNSIYSINVSADTITSDDMANLPDSLMESWTRVIKSDDNVAIVGSEVPDGEYSMVTSERVNHK